MKKQFYICAALSGLLMCAAFNFEYLWPLCFFALIPMLTALYNNGPDAPGNHQPVEKAIPVKSGNGFFISMNSVHHFIP